MSELFLVTGAAGHLGGTIVKKLLERGKKVRALVLPGEKYIPEGVSEIFFGDVCDVNSIEPAFVYNENESLIVIHCAGIVSIASKYNQSVYDVNVIGTKNVVDLCEMHKIFKLVYVSSVHALPEKRNPEIVREASCFKPDDVVGLYAKTKSEATSYVLTAAGRGLNASVVHPSGITGPFDYGRGHLTTLIIDYCKRRLTAGMNGGYDFVDVRDVADGIVSACEKGRKGECYILSNKFFTVREMLHMLHKITGNKEIKTFLPLWFVKVTAPLAELYYKILKQKPLYTVYSIYTLNTNAQFSHEKATRELDYTTRDMYETLTDTINWLEDQKRI
ncbi:MAG: NAD-dependent epimerase/dehydratase family protein [Bacillota bacterium]